MPPLPNPGVPTNRAYQEAAWALVEAHGDLGDIDDSGVVAAELAEAKARRQARIFSEAHAAADDNVSRWWTRTPREVIKGLQGRYSKVAGAFVDAARRLPEGLVADVALRLGGQVRVDWLAVEDGVIELTQLRGLVSAVGDIRERESLTPAPGGDVVP